MFQVHVLDVYEETRHQKSFTTVRATKRIPLCWELGYSNCLLASIIAEHILRPCDLLRLLNNRRKYIQISLTMQSEQSSIYQASGIRLSHCFDNTSRCSILPYVCKKKEPSVERIQRLFYRFYCWHDCISCCQGSTLPDCFNFQF